MRRVTLRALVGGSAVAALVACGNDSGTTGQLTVRLTDSPVDIIQSATVWVSSVYLIGGNDTTGPRYTITSSPQSYDLLTLTDGATAALGSTTIPTGDYTQMRLVVDSARVTLRSGHTFSDGSSSRTVQTPSANRTGIKVNFSGPVRVAPGETILVVDFDVSRNFVFTGPRSNPTGVLFKPVLHAVVQDVAASIAGTVSPASARARLYAIQGTDTLRTATADTLTGTYSLRFLPPGDYTVVASATGYQNASRNITLRAAQDTSGVNFTLTP